MSTNYNPQIVTDGLALYLDAGNSKNYNLTAVEVLVVAGGGAGGYGEENQNGGGGGGGGAGGLIYNSNFTVTPGSALTVTVGDGGAVVANSATTGGNGGNSVFGSLTAIGGGGGGGGNFEGNNAGATGGSGGGAGGDGNYGSTIFSSGTSGQGFAGGARNGTTNRAAAGGGGAGGAGSSATPGANSTGTGGTGGTGLGFNISGTFTYYAGGGGGGASNNFSSGVVNSSGGVGGGGAGGGATGPSNGTTNTGGGGGGGYGSTAGAGGSGIVIVRYPGPQKAIGGTVTSVAGYTIHTFTTVGSTTFTPLVATNNSAILGLSDFSGNNNFGTTVNSPTYSSSNDGSVSFDGTNDYITTANTTISGSQTFSVWMSVGTTSPNSPAGVLTQHNYSSTANFGINHIGGNRLAASIGYTNNTREYDNKYTTFAPTVNTIFNVVLVYNSTENKIYWYINGQLDSSYTLSATPKSTNWPICLGRWDAGYNDYYFNGKVYSGNIYNRALTAAEIQQNYNALKGRYVIDIVKGGLVLHLDSGSSGGYSGTTWRDLSGVIGDVNVQNRSTDWSFQTDSSSGQVCLYNDSNRISNPGIDIPVNNGFNKLEGTIDLWLKPTSHTGGIGWFNNSDGNSYTNSSNWFWIGTWATSYVLYFRQGNESTCCNDLTISSFTSSYPLNTWQHWCVTWKVSTGFAAIYKNGTLQTSTTGLPTNIPNTNPTNTGQLFNGHTRGDNMQFRGYCNAYKIYNRALSAEEVLQNFNALRGRFGI